MTRRVVFLACILPLFLSSNVRADPYVTTNATLNIPTLAGISSVIHVDAGTNVGVNYTNVFAPGAVTVGSPLVSVGSTLLGQYTVGPSPGTSANFNVANHNIVATFALGGNVISMSGGLATSQFTQGTLRIYDTGSIPYQTANPATWTTGSLLAEYRLAFQDSGVHENVISGTSGPFFGAQIVQPGPNQDTSAANTLSPFNSNNNILFNRVSGDFLVPNLPANTLIDGLFANSNETILNPMTGGDNGLGAAGIQLLNAIGNSFIGRPFADNSPGGTFAPGNVTLPSFNGDTTQSMGVTLYPVFQPFTPVPPGVIPEPASIALWGLLTAGLGLWGGLRRLRTR